MTIRAAADGSALGNPGPAGWAWYIDDDNWSAGGWKHATNNQGELTAVLQLFRETKHIDDDLLILCDSQYVINCITKWMPGWKRKGWRKADGKPVLNVELLKEIDAELVGRRYSFEWVKGHANHPLNEAADARARAVSEAYQRGRSIPSGPGFGGRGGIAAPPVAPPAIEEPSLFSFADEIDEIDEETVSLTITLTRSEYDRLASRATLRKSTVEDTLRALI
jgi:ribonuclease HI